MAESDELEDFVAYSLEKEHGDLGLGSPCPQKPPLSTLGRALTRSPQGTRAARNLADAIADRAENNIALALARLEMAHAAPTLEASRTVSDRLPPTITALFDAGMVRVEAQPAGRRELGLRAIAAVAHFRSKPVRFADLERWLAEAELRAPAAASHIPHRSLEEVLHAANGFLVITSEYGEAERYLKTYHTDFYVYASQGYRPSLAWATAELTFSNDRFKRHMTLQAVGMPGTTSKGKPIPGTGSKLEVDVDAAGQTDGIESQGKKFRFARRKTAWG